MCLPHLLRLPQLRQLHHLLLVLLVLLLLVAKEKETRRIQIKLVQLQVTARIWNRKNFSICLTILFKWLFIKKLKWEQIQTIPTGTNYHITPKNTELHSYIATSFTLYQSTKHTIHVVQKIYSKIKHKKLFHYNTHHASITNTIILFFKCKWQSIC